MVNPTPDDVRSLMDLNTNALTDQRANYFIAIAAETVTNTADKLAILYFACWKIAKSASWSHVTRIGDESFSPPDPTIYEEEYKARCADLNVVPKGLNRGSLRKTNSALDDYPLNLND